MAKIKKPVVSEDEKFTNQDFDLFEAITAIDKKDYAYYNRLSPEQQKKFSPYMMLHWISTVKAQSKISQFYVIAVNEYANKYIFNENIQKHPELAWLMLCASSPGIGKQFHQYLPQLKEKIGKLKEPAKAKDIKEYYRKIYPTASNDDLDQITEAFVDNHAKKFFFAEHFPNLKFDDIEVLGEIISDTEIEQYKRDLGN